MANILLLTFLSNIKVVIVYVDISFKEVLSYNPIYG